MASNPLMVYIISSSSHQPPQQHQPIHSAYPFPTWKRVPQDKGSAKRCVCFTKLGHFLATKTGRFLYHRGGGGKTGATREKRTTLRENKRGNSFRSQKKWSLDDHHNQKPTGTPKMMVSNSAISYFFGCWNFQVNHLKLSEGMSLACILSYHLGCIEVTHFFWKKQDQS